MDPLFGRNRGGNRGGGKRQYFSFLCPTWGAPNWSKQGSGSKVFPQLHAHVPIASRPNLTIIWILLKPGFYPSKHWFWDGHVFHHLWWYHLVCTMPWAAEMEGDTAPSSFAFSIATILMVINEFLTGFSRSGISTIPCRKRVQQFPLLRLMHKGLFIISDTCKEKERKKKKTNERMLKNWRE